jgi:pectin methylesterase-like acyl-CoA thioesterase
MSNILNKMKKQLNEQFKRMQKLAGILNENLKFKDVNKDTYDADSNFSIFKKGDKVHVVKIKIEGQQVSLWLSKDNTLTNKKSNNDIIIGDLEEPVGVFS